MYSKILCPIDGSDVSSLGLREALRLARNQNATVHILHILDLGPVMQYPLGDDVLTPLREAAQHIVDKALKAAREQGVQAAGSVVEIVMGRVSPTIIEQADTFPADLIVMGTHGHRGLTRLLLGSDATAVAAKAKMPVLLVK